jgi:hypothetical protein
MARRATAVSANRMFVIATVLITLVFVLLVSRTFSAQKTAVSVPTPTPAYSTLADTIATRDSDGDGIPDWEEILLGTDPEDPDQNKNGILDGEERDQFVQSPPKSALAFAGASTTPDTLTDAVAQDLMSTFMGAVHGGNKLDADVTGEILDRALLKSGETIALPQYTKSDVRTVPATQTNAELYLETVREALYTAGSNAPGEYHALAILVTEPQKGVEALRATAKEYTLASDTLSSTRVPEDAVDMHVSLVSAVLDYTAMLTYIANYEADAVTASMALPGLGTAQQNLQSALVGYFTYRERIVPTETITDTDSAQSSVPTSSAQDATQ